jgi:uncharacterized protein involved in exopolysaccharide biosynthesis
MAEPARREPPPVEVGMRTVTFLLRNRWIALMGAFLMAAVLVAIPLIRRRTYTVRTSFSPEAQDNGLGAYAGIAAQLGVQLPLRGQTQPPDYYVYTIRSDALLRPLVHRWFTPQAGEPDSAQLATLLDVTAPDSAVLEFRLLRELRRILRVRYEARAQLVQVTITTRWPGVSYGLSVALLERVDAFNRQVLRTRAGEQRRFSEGRVNDIGHELSAAEDSLASFLARNREFRTSPLLTLEESRLEREVQMEQTLYTTLRQVYEQARIDEIRNTPVISVIESPSYPGVPDRRFLLVRAALGVVLGAGLGLVLGIGRNIYRRASTEEPALVETAEAEVGAFLGELRSPGRIWGEVRREWGS